MGEYAVTELVGSGGMGAVYRAHDPMLGRDVALKLVHESMLGRPFVREAFVTEARAMARVQHTNVVTIHAFGEHRRRPYLVMEYLRGSTLATWRTEHPDASLAEIVGILEPLCRGVSAIHAAGTLHRDLKPGNVLVEHGGRVAVTDFGLACPTGVTTGGLRGFAFGTPAYIAPEVAREEVIDRALASRIDTYAIGLIAFELLTGRRPFLAKSVPALLDEHAYASAPRASEAAAGVPAAFDDVLLRALAKSPAARTASVEELRRELFRAYQTLLEFPRGLRILVVDDEAPTLTAMRELLLESIPGAEVITVTNTVTAAAIAIRERPDVVVTDLHMPDGGGAALTTMLRADPRTVATPIIIVTGHGGAAHWRELRALGADRFLVKPVDVDALVAMIRGLVRAQLHVSSAAVPRMLLQSP